MIPVKKPVIVFLDTSTLNRDDLDFEALSRLGKIKLYSTTSKNEVFERVKNAEIIITNKVDLTAEVISHASKLRFITICATGINNVDLDAAKIRKIPVSNVAGYSTMAVAQQTMAFILNWATQIHRYIREAKSWADSPTFTRLAYRTIELSGLNLGLLGTGRIGSAVGKIAEAFGMTVYAWDSGKNLSSNKMKHQWPRLSLRKLLSMSDVVSLHCPLTENTSQIINQKSICWMKKGAFLVNTGRGALVDEAALKNALLSGHLSGAGLDVLSVEPPPSEHLLLNLDFPNLMITPHTAWTTYEARNRLIRETAANIEVFLNGRDRNRVV